MTAATVRVRLKWANGRFQTLPGAALTGTITITWPGHDGVWHSFRHSGEIDADGPLIFVEEATEPSQRDDPHTWSDDQDDELRRRERHRRSSSLTIGSRRQPTAWDYLQPDRISTLNDPEQHDDNGDRQEDVDETSKRVGRDDPEQPQDEEDDDEC
jgi:hypothetical protein